MPETYRKSKVEHYLERLLIRKQGLIRQLEMSGLEQSCEFIRGQLSATDMIIWEIASEFDFIHMINEGRDGHDSEHRTKCT
ncbi:hypothetical protein ACHHV8_26950 [Paenibacillus sp. TAB 01]|uniref:hypothetical protein n=1 Tax=Paenibacillus sp. TAB 01 TaxID=3368988 RepID=UPI003750FDFF